MSNFVLRKDVMSLKEATKQVQVWVGADIHEAADLVFDILAFHDSPIQFWKLPMSGLPFKDTNPGTKGYMTEFIESRWWDEDHQREREELCKLAGEKRYQRLDKIEDVALLRIDVDKLFAGVRKRAIERGDGSGGDPEFIKSKNIWEFAKAMPKSRLVSINHLFAALSSHSRGRAPSWEFAKAFCHTYDGDKMMIYRENSGWLAEPVVEGSYYGYNKRADISCDVSNNGNALDPDYDQYLILREDAEAIGKEIWYQIFGDDSLNGTPFFDDLVNAQWVAKDAACSASACVSDEAEAEAEVLPGQKPIPQTEPDIDPSDLPIELDAANMAYRAVLNGYGSSDTFRNRLIEYLFETFPYLKNDAIQRIATVANPDKTTGRKKREKE